MGLSSRGAPPPISNARARSGLRFGLPGELSTIAAAAAPSTFDVFGAKKCNASVVPGWTPEAPNAPRNRTLFTQDHFGKNGSSDTTQETPSLGEYTALKFLPNALFLSVRRPAVTNRRPLDPNCSSTNPPTVTLRGLDSSASVMDPAL